MQGNITFMSFSNLDSIDLNNYDLKLHITRSINKGIYKDFIHVPQLSPSRELRDKAIYKWKKLKFTNQELNIMKEGKSGTWFDIYEIAFINEMNTRNDFSKAYNRIKFHLDNGSKILAICYCDDASKCHRSLIHSKLIAEGYSSILID